MKKASISHVPFAQLPIEARVLFSIYASAALAKYCSRPLTLATLGVELDAVWDANRLTLRDLSNPDRMTELLESQFAVWIARGTRKRMAVVVNRYPFRTGAQ